MKKINVFFLIAVLFCVFTSGTVAEAGSGIMSTLQKSGSLYAENAVPPITVNPESIKPMLSIDNGADMPVYSAGSTATLTLPVKNITMYDAKNVVITIEPDDKESFPFEFNKINLSRNIDRINAHQTKNVVFEFDIGQYAPEGTYLLKINFSYSNEILYLSNAFTSTQYIAIKVTNKNTLPKLTVGRIALSPETVSPGEKTKLSLNIKNIGTLKAKDIKVTLAGLRSDGFSIDNSTDVRYISSLGGQDGQYVSYPLIASKALPGGNQPLEVKIDYKDEKNTAYSETNQISIPVTRPDEIKLHSQIAIENVESPKTMIAPDRNFTIGFNIVNRGAADARNLKISLSADKEIIPKSLSTIVINSLKKGESKKLKFTLAATSDAVTRNYPIGINVEYDENQGDKTERSTITQYAGVYIENEKKESNDDKSKTIPRIIVNQYNFEPSQINAGEEFKLRMSFLNTNKSIGVSNIKVSVLSEDGTFTAANSSSTFYIESIAPKGSTDKELVLTSKSDVAPKSYSLGVNFEYEDSKGNQYNTKEIISIPVQQIPRLVTGEINMSPETFAGQPSPVFIDFYNMGKSTLYNLMVKVEGDFQIQGSGYFVGNFEPGRSDSFDSTVIPNAAGESKGNIVFTFEDASGKQMEIKKEFTMNAMEMMPMDGPEGMGPEGDMPMQGKDGKKGVSPIILVVGGVLLLGAAIAVIIILRKKIRVRKELTLDE